MCFLTCNLSGTQVNSLLDNPCVTLSNVGSYTNWIADFGNSQCSRTVNNSYGASVSNSYCGYNVGAGYNTSGSYSLSTCTTSNGYSEYCTNQGFTVVVEAGPRYNCNGTFMFARVLRKNNYFCPSGGTLSGSTCTKIDTEYKLFSSF